MGHMCERLVKQSNQKHTFALTFVKKYGLIFCNVIDDKNRIYSLLLVTICFAILFEDFFYQKELLFSF